MLKPKLVTTLKTYSKEQLIRDIISGIIVAIIALPLSIALAISSGASPEKGLHTAIIAGFIISLLGGSRVQIGGPSGTFMVIVYTIGMQYGMEGVMITTVMAGIIMIVMGFAKIGGAIKFIPYPVTTGFTSGIALIIFSSQIKDFFGLKIGQVPAEFIGQWKMYIDAFETIDIQTTLIGVISLMIIILIPKATKKIPGALVAVVFAAMIVKMFGLQVHTIGTKFESLSSSLPVIQNPHFTIEKIRFFLGSALTIAILGSVESLLSAVVSDGMIGGKHRSNMELIAVGIANIVTGLFGGIPATGALARTVANVKNGGRTPVAGMVHSAVLLLIMLLFMPLVKMVPLSSLAAVLIVVSYNMSEWREFKDLFKAPKSDVTVLLSTFCITVIFDLVKAIEISMVLASLLFMKRMTDVSEASVRNLDLTEVDDELDYYMEKMEINKKSNIQVYEINGPFFFGAADKFLNALNRVDKKTKILIIDMRNVPAMDGTALQAFKRIIKVSKDRKIKLIISGINSQPRNVLEKSGLVEMIGERNFFDKFIDAAKYALVI
jgi:SulP family sulfate permease